MHNAPARCALDFESATHGGLYALLLTNAELLTSMYQWQ
jgi:hypothetical protein